jgi:hypothetical protein
MIRTRVARGVIPPILIAVIIFLASVQPAAATTGNRAYATGNYSVTLVAPAWTGQAYYFAYWREALVQDAGTTFWSVSKIELGGFSHGGQDCQDANVCKGWSLTTKVEFLNSSGTVVKTISGTSMPNEVGCWSYLYDSSKDKQLTRCAVGPYQIGKTSANRIRFTWKMCVSNGNMTGCWQEVKRTVYL